MNFVKAALGSAGLAINMTVDQYLEFATELSLIYNNGPAAAKINDSTWDIAVLQGWLHAENYPDGARTQFINAVKQFNEVITRNGAKTVLYKYIRFLQGLEKGGVDEYCNYGYEGSAGWGSKTFIGQPLANAHKYRALLEAANKNNPPPVTTSVRRPVQRTGAVAGGGAASPGRAVVDIRGRAAAVKTVRHTTQLLMATGVAAHRTVLL